jgi:hypothetical protein
MEQATLAPTAVIAQQQMGKTTPAAATLPAPDRLFGSLFDLGVHD